MSPDADYRPGIQDETTPSLLSVPTQDVQDLDRIFNGKKDKKGSSKRAEKHRRRRSERRQSKVNLSDEDKERRLELKRALRQRLKDDLLTDRRPSQGGYDKDAELIRTPDSADGAGAEIDEENRTEIRHQGPQRLETSVWEDDTVDSFSRNTSRSNINLSRIIPLDSEIALYYKMGSSHNLPEFVSASEDQLRLPVILLPADAKLDSVNKDPPFDDMAKLKEKERKSMIQKHPDEDAQSSTPVHDSRPHRALSNRKQSLRLSSLVNEESQGQVDSTIPGGDGEGTAESVFDQELYSLEGDDPSISCTSLAETLASITIPARSSERSSSGDIQIPEIKIAKHPRIGASSTSARKQQPRARKPTYRSSSELTIDLPRYPRDSGFEESVPLIQLPETTNTGARTPSNELSDDGKANTELRHISFRNEPAWKAAAAFEIRSHATEESAIPSTRRLSTARRDGSLPKKARFKEELEENKPSQDPISQDIRDRENASSHDGGEEMFSAQRRRGYGFRFVPGESEDAASLWERALQEHAWEVSPNHRNRRKSMASSTGARSTKSHAVPTYFLGRPFAGSRKLQRSKSMDTVSIAPDVIPIKVTDVDSKLPSKPSGTWARYPSHTRHERTSSAGTDDNVTTRDFAPVVELPPATMLDARKKAKTMPFGRGILKNLTTMYKLEKSDLRRMERGHRSSVSAGGAVRYPDLELLPKLSPAFVEPSRKQRVNSGSSYGSHEGHLKSSSEDSADEDSIRSGQTAKGWSKIYEECVTIPEGSEQAEYSDQARGLLHPNDALSPKALLASIRPVIRTSASDSAIESTIDVRQSTVDFQRALEVVEKESREQALRDAAQAWGSDPPKN